MKVVHIHRQFKPGAFSIEELFHAVAEGLRNHIELIEYEAGPRKAMLIDAWRLRKMNADIYHVTGDINYMVLLLPWRKTVLTVHDIGHFLFGLHGIKRWFYKWVWRIGPIHAARAVTSVSKATEDNIAEHLCIARRRIITINNCYSPRFRNVLRTFNTECPIVLQVGPKPYKNVPRVIAALRGIPCKLILIGELDEAIRQQLADCGISYENHVNLTHDEIAQAYADCDIVTFVSLGEGFGVPIIEAQASGRPLITANIPPMNGVAGEGACKVSPLDMHEIRNGILKINNDEVYRRQIVEIGIQKAAQFSPKVIGDQYLTLYRGITSP